MFSLRKKLTLYFTFMLLMSVVIGFQSIRQYKALGRAIDVILRENYNSVIALQNMKESLERIDSGALFILQGNDYEGNKFINENKTKFEESLTIELNNITVPGEGEKANRIKELYNTYIKNLEDIVNTSKPADERKNIYFSTLLPLFTDIKKTADDTLKLNQSDMYKANNRARKLSGQAIINMYLFIGSGILIAVIFIILTHKWILMPINKLIEFTNDVKRGNLDLVIENKSNDEIGQLGESFNEMTISLREFRRSNTQSFLRMQKAVQQAFKNIPIPIAVLDMIGEVEAATDLAGKYFGLKNGVHIGDLPLQWLHDLYEKALFSTLPVESKGEEGIVQHFHENEEHFFKPAAIPITDDKIQTAGTIIIIHDITQLRQQSEIKKGVISTVSHQLKTPLTSIRMALHLLLEDKVGELNNQQTDLLLTAKDDSDKLSSIIDNLLDISRIESGKAQLDFQKVSPSSLVEKSISNFRNAAKDKGLSLISNIPAALPKVLADETRIYHVFANIISNSIKYTNPGGEIILSAKQEKDFIIFSVSDTGIGIPPEYHRNIFEQFFRVPNQSKESGIGLGLAIAKEIIEIHGGKIWAESKSGSGSVVNFSLRCAASDSNSEKEF